MSEQTYRDAQLGGFLKELRGLVKSQPAAKAMLEKVERRLKLIFRVLETWDASHAERAETLIRLDKLEAANTSACLIFDKDLRESILPRCPVQLDTRAGDRVAEAIALERTVLE